MIKISIAGLMFLLIGLVGGCSYNNPDNAPANGMIAYLPKPVTNNAVALVGDTAYSFAGLHAGKTWQDTSADAYACDLGAGTCRTIAPLPDGIGRLAATAVTVQGKVYIFGGYTVAEDGAEKSTPEVWVFNPQGETYTRAADMPVPVDDAASLVFGDRYVLLVSGWYDTDNVANVQVLDTVENTWARATDYPGAPVFGHAGAIAGDQLLICGGVKVVPPIAPAKRRSFVLSDTCWQGEISNNAQSIRWAKLQEKPIGAAYRRAAMVLPNGDMAFYGGAMNPYNYNGIGYDGVPSTPLARIDIASGNPISWRTMPAPAGMDYRGALYWRGALVTLGGMDEEQQVLDRVQAISLDARQ